MNQAWCVHDVSNNQAVHNDFHVADKTNENNQKKLLSW